MAIVYNVENTPLGGGGVTDHGALTGLSDDDHPQYVLRGDPQHPAPHAHTAADIAGLDGLQGTFDPTEEGVILATRVFAW